MSNLSALHIFIIAFIAQFLAIGLWGYIVGIDKTKAQKTAQLKPDKHGKVIYRDIAPRVEGDDYCTLDIRKYGTRDYRLSVVYGGECLFEMSFEDLIELGNEIASLTGGGRVG